MIQPGANISGGVVLGKGVLVGTGVQVLQYCRIGDGATLGAGAVVREDVAPRTTVAGVPARELPRGQRRSASDCAGRMGVGRAKHVCR